MCLKCSHEHSKHSLEPCHFYHPGQRKTHFEICLCKSLVMKPGVEAFNNYPCYFIHWCVKECWCTDWLTYGWRGRGSVCWPASRAPAPAGGGCSLTGRSGETIAFTWLMLQGLLVKTSHLLTLIPELLICINQCMRDGSRLEGLCTRQTVQRATRANKLTVVDDPLDTLRWR